MHNPPMQLFYSTASPFARKVLVAAREAGVIDQIEILTAAASPVDRNKDISVANPTGKIPTMILGDGRTLFDSRVICEYIDGLSNNIKLFPAHPDTRIAALTLQALGDAMMDASILVRYEAFMRPEDLRWDQWSQGQTGKVTASLDYLEAQCLEILNGPITIGHVAIGCALSYIEFRGILDDWKTGHDGLAEWYSRFSQRDSMKATEPS